VIHLAISAALLAGAAQAEPLRIGVTSDYPPFLWRDAGGERRGFDAELLADLCARGDFQCELVEMPLGDLLRAVAAAKVDLAAGGIGFSAERDATVDFTCSYALYDDYVGTIHARHADIDLATARIAVTARSLFEHAALKAGHRTAPYPTDAEAVRAAASGAADAYFGAPGMVESVLGANHLLQPVGELDVPPTGAAFVLPEGAERLRMRLNALLAELSAEGRIAALQEEWLGFNQGDIIAECDLTFFQS
jgi:polar amino acid transport system substrate-binding protein